MAILPVDVNQKCMYCTSVLENQEHHMEGITDEGFHFFPGKECYKHRICKKKASLFGVYDSTYVYNPANSMFITFL
jgi:hypothetical protein